MFCPFVMVCCAMILSRDHMSSETQENKIAKYEATFSSFPASVLIGNFYNIK